VTVVATEKTSSVVPADQFTYYEPGCTTIGFYDPTASVFYPRYSNTAGYTDNFIVYGAPGDDLIPIVGDWNGDGTQTIGLYDRTTGTFYLSNSNASQIADITFVFGPAGSDDVPVVGDWTGSGKQTVGLYDPTTATFYLRDTNTTGIANTTFVYGTANAGMTPVAGDWTGSGADTVGLYDPTTSTFALRNDNSAGTADTTFAYGPAGNSWTPVVGDWTGSGTDTVGLYSPTDSLFYLRDSNTTGDADTVVVYGAASNGWTPIVGKWMGDSQAELAASAVVTSPDTTALTDAQLAPVVNQAIAAWSSAGLSAAQLQKLRQAQFVITDLPGSYLGKTTGDVIQLDANAAGNGWFVDPTPASNAEFAAQAGSSQLKAVDPQAVDHIDLLSVVEHELGHIVGLGDNNALPDDIMDGILGVGARRIVSHADAVLASV
jgi:hypothetical protein